jgi:glutamate/tyrosine decarboxylase-like PLP-dependent enzyme
MRRLAWITTLPSVLHHPLVGARRHAFHASTTSIAGEATQQEQQSGTSAAPLLPDSSFIHPNGDNQAVVTEFVQSVVDLLLSEMSNAGDRSPFPNLSQLPTHEIPNQGMDERELLSQLQGIIQQSMNAAHPGYIGHMDSIPSTPAILGDLVAGALNNNMLSVEMSPVFSRLEPLILKEIATMFGLPEDTSGGALISGGSLGNIQAIAVARNHFFPDIIEHGLAGLEKPPVFFTSVAAHSSFQKAAMVLGLGSNAAIGVATDEAGKLDCDALKKAIAQAHESGQAPFAIVATAGSTVIGSIDPMEAMAVIAKDHNLWFHVDASYGGALVFGAPKYKALLDGIDQADSITFNPQKWLYVAKTCAMTLFRDASIWKSRFRIGAPYMGEANDNAINIGEVSLQGTRHADVLKLWMTLQHLGKAGCAEIMNHNFDMTDAFLAHVKHRPVLRIATPTEPEMNIVCFRSEPEHLPEDDWDEWNTKLQDYLLVHANCFLALPVYNGGRWLKVVLLNPFTSEREFELLFEKLDEFHNASAE